MISVLPSSSSSSTVLLTRSSCSCSSSYVPRTATLPRTFSFRRKFNNEASPRTFDSSNRSRAVTRSASDEVTAVIDSLPSVTDSKTALITSSKLKLLAAVSGLNRGLAASKEDLKKVDAAATEIEAAGGQVDIVADLSKLQGRWRLVYSSAFSSQTLGGSRSGPSIGRLLPITLGQVFQRIDILNKDFDNIVELSLGTPWPLPKVEFTATLAHKFVLIGSSTIKIEFEKTSIKATGDLSQLPQLDVPQLPESLRPQTNRGSGEFEVTYVDTDTRITRGDRGELRVFVIA